MTAVRTHHHRIIVCHDLYKNIATEEMMNTMIDIPPNSISIKQLKKNINHDMIGKEYDFMPAKSPYRRTKTNSMPDLFDDYSNKIAFPSRSATKKNVSISARNLSRTNDVTNKVTFSSVEIRQYELILGDNPACTDGNPLSIGWKHYTELTVIIPVNKYENERKFQRSALELRLARWKRENILHDLGYSDHDLAENVRFLNKVKFQRNQTVNNLPVAKMELVVEEAREKMKKIISKRQKKKLLNCKKQLLL